MNGKDLIILDRVLKGLRRASVLLPHLSGLAHHLRVVVDQRVPTAGIFPSGRVLVNPDFFDPLSLDDIAFVMAHEMLHLGLDTQGRTSPGRESLYNIAHDLIINDMLMNSPLAPEFPPEYQGENGSCGSLAPAGGLWWNGARHLSLEALVQLLERESCQELGEIRRQIRTTRHRRPPPDSSADSPMRKAMERAGLLPESVEAEDPSPRSLRDVRDFDHHMLPSTVEDEWFPGEPVRTRQVHIQELVHATRRVATLQEIQDRLASVHSGGWGSDAGHSVESFQAFMGGQAPSWESVLQPALEGMAPPRRSYARASRRGGNRSDLVMPGLRYEGWRLCVVLDTSGSMVSEFPRILGQIVEFCHGSGVSEVRVVECDTQVTADRVVSPDGLLSYPIHGLGGSDLCPALQALASDGDVEGVVVLTDGYVSVPETAPPFRILWVVTGDGDSFRPGYGQIVGLENPAGGPSSSTLRQSADDPERMLDERAGG